MRNSTMIRAALLAKGQTLSSWARGRGFDSETARRIVYRWSTPRPGCPEGLLTRSILSALAADIGIHIPPGVDWRAADAAPAATTKTAKAVCSGVCHAR